MQPLPKSLQDILTHLTQSFSGPALREGQKNLSQRYRQAQSLASAHQRLTYLVTRLPATYQGIAQVLKRLREHSSGALETVKTVLDLGAGPGTGSWVLHESCPALQHVTCLEKERGFIDLGQQITAPLALTFQWLQQDLTHLAFSTPHDLVLLSYVLGELKPHDQWGVVRKAFSLAQQLLILIEPGTPAGYRRLVAMRDLLIQQGAHILAPCPHNEACPLENQKKDWCHFAVRLARTPLHCYAKEGQRMWEDEPYTYLVAAPLASVPSAGTRILKPPRIRSGHVLLHLCTAKGLVLETVSKKDKKRYEEAKRKIWGASWPETKENE